MTTGTRRYYTLSIISIAFCVSQISNGHAQAINWDNLDGSLGFPAIKVNDTVLMDLSVTRGMSYDDVVSQIGPGLRFDGWAIATGDQASLAFAGLNLNLGQSVQNRAPLMALGSIWGGAFQYQAFTFGAIYTVADPGKFPLTHQSGSYRYDRDFGWYDLPGLASSTTDDGLPDRSFVLIRVPLAVPEPSAGFLICLSAFTFRLRARCCNQR